MLTLIAGVGLWRARPWGLTLSVLAQLAQVPYVVWPPLAYQIVLGFFVVCQFQPDTWVVHFNAEVGTVDYRVSWAGQGIPSLGVNLAAAGLALHLLRVRWRASRPGAPQEVTTLPWPRRWLRALARWLLIAGAVVAVPVLAFWVYNRFDEAPTPASRRWFAPIVHHGPEAGTGWLFRLGIGAAEGDDPIAFGRKRLAAFEAWVADLAAGRASAAEKVLEADALPFNWAPQGGAKLDVSCDSLQRDCLAWARDNAADLGRLEAANAVRLRRFERLLDLQHFEDLSTPTLDSPTPSIGNEDALYRALTLRDLVDPARRASGLQRVQRAVTFWQRNIDGAANAATGRLAEQSLERHLRLVDALLSRLDPREIDAVQAQLLPLLQTMPPSRERWEPVLRRQAMAFERVLRRTRAGALNPFESCSTHCLRDWAVGQFVVSQATRNLSAKLLDALLDEHVADARDHASAQQPVQAVVRSLDPFSDDLREMLRKLSYNYNGKTLVVIWLPAYAGALHLQHDLNDLRRLLRLKMAARQPRVSPAGMPAFLARQPDALRQGFTGRPFDWDPVTRQIRFEAKSTIWKRQHLAVVLP